jgi:hypothetical protein
MRNNWRKSTVFVAACISLSLFIITIIPIHISASTTAEELVLKAEKHKVPLIKSISVDYEADGIKQPWSIYNQAKNDYATASVAVKKLKGSKKEQLSARLTEVKLWIDRTAIYIDAITSGQKLISNQKAMEQLLNEGKLKEATAAYHTLSYEIKKQAAFLYRVYGQSTRQSILEIYKLPAERSKHAALYPVSVHIEINRVHEQLLKGNLGMVEKHIDNIDTWMKKVQMQTVRTKLQEGYYNALSSYIPEVMEVY